jgi:hypothetical protein
VLTGPSSTIRSPSTCSQAEGRRFESGIPLKKVRFNAFCPERHLAPVELYYPSRRQQSPARRRAARFVAAMKKR